MLMIHWTVDVDICLSSDRSLFLYAHFFALLAPPRRPNFPSPDFVFGAAAGTFTAASFIGNGGPGRCIRSLKAFESNPVL